MGKARIYLQSHTKTDIVYGSLPETEQQEFVLRRQINQMQDHQRITKKHEKMKSICLSLDTFCMTQQVLEWTSIILYKIELYDVGEVNIISMSFNKIKLSKYQSITRIITDCNQLSQSISSSKIHYELPKLKTHYNPEQTDDDGNTDHDLYTHTRNKSGWSHNFCQYSYKQRENLSTERKQKPIKFCGEIMVSKQNKFAFRRIVHKFKKSFHPTNASKSDNNTSEGMSLQLPRKVDKFRQSIREQQKNRYQMKRLSILSQVISENTRKEILTRREKHNNRYISK